MYKPKFVAYKISLLVHCGFSTPPEDGLFGKSIRYLLQMVTKTEGI
jgi:hypothetical protein